MSSKTQHEERVLHNRKFFDSVQTDVYPDWAIVILFYRAVHLIEAIFDSHGSAHSCSHDERKRIMNDDPSYYSNNLRINYRELESLSRQARYRPDIPVTDESVLIAQNCFDEIQSWYNSKF